MSAGLPPPPGSTAERRSEPVHPPVTVFVPSYRLEDEAAVLNIGDRVHWLLMFSGPEEHGSTDPESVQTVQGEVRPLSTPWTLPHIPHIFTVSGLPVLYPASEPATGVIRTTGTIWVEMEGLGHPEQPEACGTVRRLRLRTFHYHSPATHFDQLHTTDYRDVTRTPAWFTAHTASPPYFVETGVLADLQPDPD